jgi:hypothetical protein
VTTTIAEDYVEALLARDWDRFAGMLAEDVHREGAEGAETDSVDTREAYLSWAKNLIDPLYEYSWVVHRVAYSQTGDVAWVEATSQYRVNESDKPFGYRLAMVLEINGDGLIQQVSLYWKTPQQRLPGDTIRGE